MAAHNSAHRLLLRAELQHGNAHIVTHSIEISETLVFVQTDLNAFVGDRVSAKFSFPGLVEPFSLETQVVAQRAAASPGMPGGWMLGFMFYGAEEQAQVKRLLTQVQAAHEGPAAYEYRVLLVEDNLLAREAFALGVSKMLSPNDHIAVDMVANGRDALDVLLHHRYDLAIIDYFLPMINGDELISELRRVPECAGLPIFAISIGGAAVRNEALAAGADLFLQKPIILRDLLGTLKQLQGARGQVPAPSTRTLETVQG